MAICLFGILINVLDFDTYQHPANIGTELDNSQREEMIKFDINALSDEERRGCTHTRGQALQIMEYVAENFRFWDKEDISRWKDVKHYQEHVIIHQCQMLLNYKTQSKMMHPPGCDLALFKVQLSGILDGEMNIKINKSYDAMEPSAEAMLIPEIPLGLQQVDNPPPITKKREGALFQYIHFSGADCVLCRSWPNAVGNERARPDLLCKSVDKKSRTRYVFSLMSQLSSISQTLADESVGLPPQKRWKSG